jgi:hypothetical protein
MGYLRATGNDGKEEGGTVLTLTEEAVTAPSGLEI